MSFSFVAMIRQLFLNLLQHTGTIHTDLINSKQSLSQHAWGMYENIIVRVNEQESFSQHVMVPVNKRLISMVMFSGDRQKERETDRERGREEPVGIGSFLRGHCLDATS